MVCEIEDWYDCTIMGQPVTDMGNHSKVITGQKYSTPVSAFLPKFPLNAKKINFNLTTFFTIRQYTTKHHRFRFGPKT